MSNPQIEEIKMATVVCNIATHQGRVIDALCLCSQCNENATLCSKCVINSHPQCRSQVNNLDVIPKQLMDLHQLSFDIVILQQMINHHFKELLSKIEQILKPISQYNTSPNITNLNQIGSLLRTQPHSNISNLIHQTKTQIRLLLDNQNQKQQEPNKQQQQQQEPKEQEQIKQQPEQQPEQDWKYWYDKGKSLYQSEKYSEAIECYDQAIKINPNNEMNWYQKGKSLYQSEKYSEAIECYDQAIKINPNNEMNWYQKGKSLYQSEKYSEAIECYDQAIKINPTSDTNWYQKGGSLYQSEKYSEAIECYDQAIKINPNSDTNWYQKGRLIRLFLGGSLQKFNGIRKDVHYPSLVDFRKPSNAMRNPSKITKHMHQVNQRKLKKNYGRPRNEKVH